VPTVLTVNGDYISNGGTLYMNTVLGDSDSPSDRLDVQGNVVMADPSQRTLIDVTNAAPGLGAVTTGNGILLVSVGGTSAANAFALASSSPDYGNDADGDYLGANNPANGYVDAGAFRYRLFQGDGSDDSWYLRTQSTPPPLPPPLCSDGTEPPCVEPPPPPPPGPVDPEYNPDVGLITVLPGILAQSNLDILDNLHRRKGDDLNVMQNDDRLWARIFGSDSVTHRQENVASPEAKGNRYGFQAGVDLFQNRDGNGKRNDVGLYAAYVKAHFNVTGITDTSLPASWVGILRPETTALGAYWTYQRSAGSGFYSDLIFQYNFYGGEGQRQDGTRVQIDGAGYLGSWEIGFGKQMSEHWSIQPQAQIVAQKSDIDDIAIANGRASYDDKLALSGRLGLRLVGDYTSDSGRQWKPYIRANYWHGFDGKRTTTFQTQGGSTPIQTQMGYDTAELGVGFTVAMTRNVNLYAEADHVFGIGKASRELSQGIAGNVGIRVMFGREPAPAPVVAPPPPPPPPAVAAPPPPPPPAPPPAPVRLTLSADALFDFDSAQLRPAGQEMLAGFVRDLRGLQYEVLIIEGHTDRIGSDTYNQALSDRRANSVRDYLTGNGIPANNVRATGYGETRPVTTPEQCPPSLARDALLACLQPDRRVEVEVSGLRQL
jgi:outer membrane autotransporter protein